MKRVLLLFLPILFIIPCSQAQRLLKTLSGHQNTISSIGFSVNGRVLVSSSWDKTIRMWNPVGGETTKIIETGKSVVFSAALSNDMKSIACGSWAPSVNVYSTITGEKQKSFMAHPSKVDFVGYSPDGHTLVTAGDDTIKLWDAVSLNFKARLAGHTGDIHMAVFSPNGKMVASNSSTGVIKIWDASNGALIKSLYAHINNAPAVVFSDDGKMLLTLGEEGTLKVWDANTFALQQTFTKIIAGANCMDLNSDNKTVAIAGKDNNAYLFDLVEKKIVGSVKGHSKQISHLCFSPDGNMLATAAEDNLIMIWDVSDLKYRKCIEEKMKVHSQLIEPKGEFETTEQYKKRLGEYEKFKVEMKKECMKEDALKQVEQVASQQDNMLATYKYVNLKIALLSNYNADKQTYEVTIEGNVYTLKMAMTEAKSFKTVWQTAAVKGIQRANPTTKKAEYINLQVVHPLTNVAYPVGTQVSPTTDKYLKEFLDKNPEPKG